MADNTDTTTNTAIDEWEIVNQEPVDRKFIINMVGSNLGEDFEMVEPVAQDITEPNKPPTVNAKTADDTKKPITNAKPGNHPPTPNKRQPLSEAEAKKQRLFNTFLALKVRQIPSGHVHIVDGRPCNPDEIEAINRGIIARAEAKYAKVRGSDTVEEEKYRRDWHWQREQYRKVGHVNGGMWDLED